MIRKAFLFSLVAVFVSFGTSLAADDSVNRLLGLFGLQTKQKQAEPAQEQQQAAEQNNTSEEDKKLPYYRVMDGTQENNRFIPSGPREGLSPDKKKVTLYIDTGANAYPLFEKRDEVSLPARYIDNGNGTMKDTMVTGLTWMKDTNCLLTNYPELDTDKESITEQNYVDGRVHFKTAKKFVEGINKKKYPKCGFGYTDWRFPTNEELNTLMHMDEKAITVKSPISDVIGNPHGQVDQYFTKWLYYQGFNVKPMGGAYWTSNNWIYNLSNLEPKVRYISPAEIDNTVAGIWLVRGKSK